MTERYPWYELVEGDELEQGDIIEGCPISVAAETETADVRWKLQWPFSSSPPACLFMLLDIQHAHFFFLPVFLGCETGNGC